MLRHSAEPVVRVEAGVPLTRALSEKGTVGSRGVAEAVVAEVAGASEFEQMGGPR